MAHASEDANDKALWITLAQSWVRLAEHAAHMSASSEAAAIAGKAAVQDAFGVAAGRLELQILDLRE